MGLHLLLEEYEVEWLHRKEEGKIIADAHSPLLVGKAEDEEKSDKGQSLTNISYAIMPPKRGQTCSMLSDE